MNNNDKFVKDGNKIMDIRFYSKFIVPIAFILMFPIASIIQNLTGSSDAGMIAISVMVFLPFLAYIYINIKYWKCPKCERGFNMRGSMDRITHCPYCGVRLCYAHLRYR